MQAIVWTGYGPPDVLQLQAIAQPAPGDKEVLIHIQAATVATGDCELRSLKFPLGLQLLLRLYAGPLRPHRITILGQEVAGEIVAVGKEVTRFRAGDPVFSSTGMRFGAYAEYLCLPESAILTVKPAKLRFADAVCLPVGGDRSIVFSASGQSPAGAEDFDQRRRRQHRHVGHPVGQTPAGRSYRR
jgi:NADPH:quinone reductase-like Zn-dependent oxidoreductase